MVREALGVSSRWWDEESTSQAVIEADGRSRVLIVAASEEACAAQYAKCGMGTSGQAYTGPTVCCGNPQWVCEVDSEYHSMCIPNTSPSPPGAPPPPPSPPVPFIDFETSGAMILANGAQFFLAPQSAIDLYEMKGTNRLCQAMTSMMGGQMLCVGTYLAALLMDKSQSEAFAYAMAVNGLTAAKFAFTDADDLNVPKAGPLVWAALSLGLAYKALN